MDVPEATTPPVSSGVRFLGIARSKPIDMFFRGSTSSVAFLWQNCQFEASEKLSELMIDGI